MSQSNLGGGGGGSGDITAVTAGTNLDGGGTSGAVTLNLTTETIQDVIGAMISGNTETRITVTYDDVNGKLDFSVDDMTTDANTTYSISCVDGANSDEEIIRLTDSASVTDDVILEAGTGLTITRVGDKITITNSVSDTDTTYTAGDALDLTGTTFSSDLKSGGGLVIDTTELAVDTGIADGKIAKADGTTNAPADNKYARWTANGLEGLSAADVRTDINVSDGANNYSHPNHTGDVTSVTDGATTIANDAVTYAKVQDVTATDKILGRVTAGAGIIEEIACTSAGRAILDDADALAQRTTLGLAIGTDVEAFDAATAKTDEANDFTAAQSGAIDTTQASTGVCDLSEGNNHEITIAGSTTISVSNPVAGMSGVIKIIHDGSNVPSFSGFKFPDGTVPTITNTASNVDILAYYCESTSRVSAVYHSNMS